MKFESHLLTYISQNLKSTLQFDSKLLSNNVVVVNVAKFCQFAADAVLQGTSLMPLFCQLKRYFVLIALFALGRFIDGAEQTYDLLATILETLYSMDNGGGGLVGRRGISDQTASTLYRAFNRMVLLKISDLEQGGMESDQIVAFLNYCIHHQKIILSGRNTDQEFLRCFCYHLYQFLSSSDDAIKKDALNVSMVGKRDNGMLIG
jgi:nitrite reductase/ring-hydroxylating ferredoxin subunit